MDANCPKSKTQDYPGYVLLDCNVIHEVACPSPMGQKAEVGINDRNFSLPTRKDFDMAEKDGIREVVPNMKDSFFWTESAGIGAPEVGPVIFNYYGKNGDIGV